MNIDEAIKHCEEKAEELEKRVKPYQCESINKKLYEVNKKEWDSCIECAKEHRQLAEWLRKLNDIEHLFSVTEKLFKACLRDDSKDIVDGHEILYSEHKQLREIFEEVNADECKTESEGEK